MAKGKTSSGFEYNITKETLDNMELVDAIVEIDEGEDPMALSKLLDMLLGDKESKKRLYDSVRNEQGKVTISAVAEQIKEIFASFEESKNS